MENQYKEIPFEAAAEFAKKFNKDVIIILSFDKVNETESVTTWGKSIHQADHAADCGNRIKRVIGWPEQHTKAVSEKVQKLIDLNQSMISALEESMRIIDIFESLSDDIEEEENYAPVISDLLKEAEETLSSIGITVKHNPIF